MKSLLIRVSVLSLLLMPGSVLFVSAQDQAVAMKTERQLTKAEAKALSMSKTPQDHLQLASYFRNEAREAENMAEVHEEIVNGNDAGPVAGTATELQMQSHDFVDNARRAAASANEMAKEQEAIAAHLEENAAAK
jgi:hypothetical protein